LPQARRKPADGPIRSGRNYNIAISVVVAVDVAMSLYADYASESSDRERRLSSLGVPGWDDLVAVENLQVLLGGLLLLGGNLTFVKVYLFKQTSYWEGAGNLFEYTFSVQTFLESVGVAVPESIGRLSKPITRLMQSSYCPCVQTNSDSPDDSPGGSPEEDEDDKDDLGPLVWTIWEYAVIMVAIVQVVVAIVAGPTRSVPPCDFFDWSTVGVVFANFQVLVGDVLVVDVLISMYESMSPDTAVYFHDAGNMFELVIAVQTLLASVNVKVPPAVGLLVKPITSCMVRVAPTFREEEGQAQETASASDNVRQKEEVVTLDALGTVQGPVVTPRDKPVTSPGDRPIATPRDLPFYSPRDLRAITPRDERNRAAFNFSDSLEDSEKEFDFAI
jgi:hypothetical protein